MSSRTSRSKTDDRDRDRDDRSRDSRRRERESDRDDRETSPADSMETDNVKPNVEVSSDGTVSCSIEETNRIRAALGLKPLRVDEKDVQRERQQIEEESNVDEVRKRIEAARMKRKEREIMAKLAKTRTLGEVDEDEDASAASWVERSRQLQREKELAAERERALRELEEQHEENESEETNNYTAEQLKGLKVAHKMSDFGENEIILTLKDTSILNNSEDINEDIDELENIALLEKDKREWVQQQKKPAYSVYDALEKQTNELLPQYNDNTREFQRTSFSLDESGGVDEQKKKKLADIRAKLAGASASSSTATKSAKSVHSLETKTSMAKDFLTQEEAEVVFKKKPKASGEKKKKRIRKKSTTEDESASSAALASSSSTQNLLSSLASNAAVPGFGESRDHASRSRSVQQKKAAEKERLEIEARQRAYEVAAEKAKQDTVALQLKSFDTGATAEEDDDEISASIARARRLAAERNARGEATVLQTVQQLKQQEEAQRRVKTEDGEERKVIFQPTAEFMKNISVDEPALGGARSTYAHLDNLEQGTRSIASGLRSVKTERTFDAKPDVQQAMEVDQPEAPSTSTSWTSTTIEEERARQQQQQPSRKPVVKREHNEDEDEEEDEATEGVEMLSEPMVAKGLAATLAFATSKGLMKQDYAGRVKDKPTIIAKGDDPAPNIHLERRDAFGRTLTPKEAYRELSHKFHGKAPGKNKQEKMLKRYQEEMKQKKLMSQETPLQEILKKTQELTQQPYMVVQGSNALLTGTSLPTVELDKKRKEPPNSSAAAKKKTKKE